MSGAPREALPASVRALLEARDRNMKGLTRVPDSLGDVMWRRYTAMIAAEAERCGVTLS